MSMTFRNSPIWGVVAASNSNANITSAQWQTGDQLFLWINSTAAPNSISLGGYTWALATDPSSNTVNFTSTAGTTCRLYTVTATSNASSQTATIGFAATCNSQVAFAAVENFGSVNAITVSNNIASGSSLQPPAATATVVNTQALVGWYTPNGAPTPSVPSGYSGNEQSGPNGPNIFAIQTTPNSSSGSYTPPASGNALNNYGMTATVLLAPAVTNVTMSDAGTGGDSVALTATIALSDAGTGGDAVALTSTITLSDAAVGADSVALTATLTLSDAGTGGDSVAVNHTFEAVLFVDPAKHVRLHR